MTYKDLVLNGYALARLYDEVSSTMDVARQTLPELQEGHGVIFSRRQTSGRGRQGRTWASTEGSLMGTFVFEASLPVNLLAGYSLSVGVGLVEAFRSIGGGLQLKWPNDLVIVTHGEIKKIGGILIEVEDLGDRRMLLVGVGVNISTVPGRVPGAAAIEHILGRKIDTDAVIPIVSETLLNVHNRFMNSGGFSAFKALWELASCFEQGLTRLTIDQGGRCVSGLYEGLDDQGALLISCAEGREVVVSGHIVSLSGVKKT